MLKRLSTMYRKIDLSKIDSIPDCYPLEFEDFCKEHNLNPPKIDSKNGKALSAMLDNPNTYWQREDCDEFCKKFNIQTNDSIQLFNKHSQWGIATQSGIEKGKLYIVYPYKLSSKYKLRKNFKYSGDEQAKNDEIDRIKATIRADYIDVPNDQWQLGHKNPNFLEQDNLVLQPPIQGKYRDEYIFVDTLTKFPTPTKLKRMIDTKQIVFTQEQILAYRDLFNSLTTGTTGTTELQE